MLDCDTPKGKPFLDGQFDTQKILEDMGYTVINTPLLADGHDVLLAKKIGNKLVSCGIAEIKTRLKAGSDNLTKDYIKKNGYLITHNKIIHGRKMSKLCNVPFFIVVRLLAEPWMMIWKVTDEVGADLFEFEISSTKTQDNANGGVAVRENAFLPFDKCKLYQVKNQPCILSNN